MKKLVVIFNFIFTFLGFLGIAMALMSPMLFDAPGSENNTYLWILFWSNIALPFVCFGSVIASWFFFFKLNNIKTALWVSMIPFTVIFVMVISIVLIQLFCNGSFSCT